MKMGTQLKGSPFHANSFCCTFQAFFCLTVGSLTKGWHICIWLSDEINKSPSLYVLWIFCHWNLIVVLQPVAFTMWNHYSGFLKVFCFDPCYDLKLPLQFEKWWWNNFFFERIVLQSISYFKVLRILNSWLSEKVLCYFYCGFNIMLYLFIYGINSSVYLKLFLRNTTCQTENITGFFQFFPMK